MIPDFSPRMLRLFIEARIVRAMIVDGMTRARARLWSALDISPAEKEKFLNDFVARRMKVAPDHGR